jgi:hypothetical protein
MYYVYAIGDPINIANKNYSECYIGVTNDTLSRWSSGHSKSKYSVAKAIKKNSWTYEKNMIIIFSGDAKECFELEYKLRPLPFMGLNEAVGGKGGHTKYTPERNKKISDALKGIPKTYGDKISKTKKENGSSKGSRNSKAVKWILKNPNGDVYNLHGELFNFCKENMLSANTLRCYLDKPVPPICTKYRGIGIIKEIRNNTTGWLLIKES